MHFQLWFQGPSLQIDTCINKAYTFVIYFLCATNYEAVYAIGLLCLFLSTTTTGYQSGLGIVECYWRCWLHCVRIYERLSDMWPSRW